MATPSRVFDGVAPVSIHIDRGQIDAPIEALDVVDGVLPMATKPFVVAWYPQTAHLASGGNVVMSGHLDHWDVGPAIFFDLNRLKPGDPIEVTGENGIVYTYYVAWVRLYDATTAPLEDITGATSVESLTLITDGGDFDYQKGQYLGRTVVRATCG